MCLPCHIACEFQIAKPPLSKGYMECRKVYAHEICEIEAEDDIIYLWWILTTNLLHWLFAHSFCDKLFLATMNQKYLILKNRCLIKNLVITIDNEHKTCTK